MQAMRFILCTALFSLLVPNWFLSIWFVVASGIVFAMELTKAIYKYKVGPAKSKTNITFCLDDCGKLVNSSEDTWPATARVCASSMTSFMFIYLRLVNAENKAFTAFWVNRAQMSEQDYRRLSRVINYTMECKREKYV